MPDLSVILWMLAVPALFAVFGGWALVLLVLLGWARLRSPHGRR